MSNVTALKQPDPIRAARAAFVSDAIDADGRSARSVALRVGINPTSFSDRLKGNVAFLADELEHIATVLHRDPVEFYAEYISAQEVGPAVLETATSTVESRQFDRPVVNIFDRQAS